MQLDTVNVAGNQSAHRRRPRLHHEGLGQRRLPGRRRDDHRQHLRQPVRAPERRHEHVLRLLDVPGRRGRDRRLAARAAELGRDDQRRHQARHQRDQGLGPLHLRLRQLAVEQHAAGSASTRACRPNNTRMHPRVRRGPRRPDHQGQALALGRRARYQTISTNPTAFDPDAGRLRRRDDEPRALEREAELADLQRQFRAALLPAQRPVAVRIASAAPDRPPETRTQLRSRPTSTRSRTRTSSPRTSSPRSSRTIRTRTTRSRQRLDSTARNGPFDDRVQGHPVLRTRTDRPSYHNNYYYYFAKDPQKQANVQVSKFFNTGKLNHELKFSFNYRQQIADSATGCPGDQN